MGMNQRLLRPTASGFDPRRIADLAAWWDMSDSAGRAQNSNGSTPATAENDPVAYVRDKSPHGRHITQTDNNRRPLLKLAAQNGLSALLFDGTDDHLINTQNFLNGSPVTVAVVAQRQVDSSVAAAVSSGRLGAASPESTIDATLRNSFLSPANNLRIESNTRRNGGGSLDMGSAPTSFAIGTGQKTQNINVTNSGDGVVVGRARDSVGTFQSAFGLNGRIGEIILYSRALSLAERQLLEAYLSRKWGIALT